MVLAATGVSLALTLGLFRLLGPKRTRTASQVLATLVGAWFVICVQIYNFLPGDNKTALQAALNHPIPGSWADPRGVLWLPARAASGDLSALACWTVLGLLDIRAGHRSPRAGLRPWRGDRRGRAAPPRGNRQAKAFAASARAPCGGRNGGCWRATPIWRRRCCCNRFTPCRWRW